MPYGNKLLSIDQLLAAWQNRNQMENNSTQTAMQQKLAEQQIEAQQLANEQAKWNLLKEKGQATASVVPDKTAGMLTGEFSNFLSTRQPLNQMPGYVTGTNPSQYQAEQAALRQALAQGHGVSSTGGQTEEDAALKTQQANLLEEQSRIAQQQRQGYGDADKYLIAQKLAEAQIGKSQDRGYNELIGRLKDQSQSTWNDINAGDRRIDDTRVMMNNIQNEIENTKIQEQAKTQVLNKASKAISSDPRFKLLPVTKQKNILNNIGAIVENNIKTIGTAVGDIGDIIAKYGK